MVIQLPNGQECVQDAVILFQFKVVFLLMEYLWYVGYGSNLCRKRFINYVQGGEFSLGGRKVDGCTDKTFLDESKPFLIPHSLFFANKAGGWSNGGVAFISKNSEQNKNKYTYGRMWKIRSSQFPDIWDQEGNGPRWYDKKLTLGQDEDDIPIVTITNSDELKPETPSDNYLKTIAIGLKETFHLNKEQISEYLIEKPGIKDKLTKDKILKIIGSN